MCSTALCRAVQKCLLWQNDRVSANSVLCGTGGFCRLGLRKQCDNEQVLCCCHQSKQNKQNQNRRGKIKTQQAKTKQTNKQPMGHQDSTREFGNDAARRNPIWGNLQTLALPRGVHCVSKRREERQVWCQLTISLENDKLSEQFWSPADSRMTVSQLQCQIYIQLAKEIYYQRQDGPWHWVNSVRHFYQFHQLFPAVTIFDCPTERTFFCEFDAIFIRCVS